MNLLFRAELFGAEFLKIRFIFLFFGAEFLELSFFILIRAEFYILKSCRKIIAVVNQLKLINFISSQR